jgi:AcrR family transcriptional regulator
MPKSGAITQKAILDAANRIVIEQGVERLTLEQVAAEAGISKGGLLYHFPTKEALIKGMINHYLERFTEDFNEASEKDGDTPGRWNRSYLTTTFADNQRIPRMSSGLLAAVATDPSLLAPLQERFREWVSLLYQDGIDPTTAAIVHLVADGLWLVELFGLSAPDETMKGKVLQAMDEMIQQSVKNNSADAKGKR